MELRDLFVKGEYFPLTDHERRIKKYERNEKLANGDHADIFLHDINKNDLYISANFAGLITRKGSDYLFGEKVVVSSGKEDSSKEQEALDRITNDNNLHTVFYQQSLQAAVKGDAFFKIRFGQLYGGAFPLSYDPKRVIIEGVDAKKVYPQTSPFDKSKIVAYHVAEAVQIADNDDKYNLYVESHYAGKIIYRRFDLNNYMSDREGNIIKFKIGDEIASGYEVVNTGVPVPLMVHVPNFSDGTDWKGTDDISEHIALFDEINNRLSQIANILDKHAEPPLALPTGLLNMDEEGQTYFHVAINKVFEVMGKDDIIPQYITWDGKVEGAFTELDKIIEFLLATSEIPAVAVGLGEGTSGSSTGLNIKWRMAGLLAKINRKRQFFEDGLKRVYMIAQMLEHYADSKNADYEVTMPHIKFNDGLPTDDSEIANRMAVRTNGSQTLSRKTALMVMDGLTEEQADAEVKRIEDERIAALQASTEIFNDPYPADMQGLDSARIDKANEKALGQSASNSGLDVKKTDNRQVNNKN
jgi:SPP1 family phage portal protein